MLNRRVRAKSSSPVTPSLRIVEFFSKSIGYGTSNGLHGNRRKASIEEIDAQTQRLDRSADRLMPDLRDLQREQDGSEIKSRELELITDRAQNLSARRDAFERMRDAAAEDYLTATGQTWRPRSGSHTSQTGKLTSAAIDARDFMRARSDRKTQAHLPEGTLVAVTGGKDVTDPAAVFNRLDKVRAKYTDILLLCLRHEVS